MGHRGDGVECEVDALATAEPFILTIATVVVEWEIRGYMFGRPQRAPYMHISIHYFEMTSDYVRCLIVAIVGIYLSDR